MSGNSSVLRVFESRNAVWDVAGQSWVAETQPGGSGGGAVTIADGADVTQGAKADAAWVAGDGTVISLLKKIASAGGSAVSISDGSDVTQGAIADAAVITDTTGTLSGKFRGLVKWAFERMPASLGQKTMANSLPIVLASDQSGVPVTGTFWQATQPVSGTFWQATQPVSGTFWQATQPVSGTVTANAGTNLNTSALALEATQLTGNTSLASIKTNSDPLVASGAGGYVRQDSTATIAKETGGNLATIATNTPTVGQKTMAGSSPVTVASDQTLFVIGTKTNNNAAPGTGGLGVLPAVATAAVQAYTEGNLVALSTDLTGAVRTAGVTQGATGSGVVGPMVQALVSDTRESYVDATVRPFSLTSDGRLRVSATPGEVYIEFFSIPGNPCFELPTLTAADDLWNLGPNGLSWS